MSKQKKLSPEIEALLKEAFDELPQRRDNSGLAALLEGNDDHKKILGTILRLLREQHRITDKGVIFYSTDPAGNVGSPLTIRDIARQFIDDPDTPLATKMKQLRRIEEGKSVPSPDMLECYIEIFLLEHTTIEKLLWDTRATAVAKPGKQSITAAGSGRKESAEKAFDFSNLFNKKIDALSKEKRTTKNILRREISGGNSDRDRLIKKIVSGHLNIKETPEQYRISRRSLLERMIEIGIVTHQEKPEWEAAIQADVKKIEAMPSRSIENASGVAAKRKNGHTPPAQ